MRSEHRVQSHNAKQPVAFEELDRTDSGRLDVQGLVAATHHLFELPADQCVVPDQVTDFPRREGVEIAHDASLAWAQWCSMMKPIAMIPIPAKATTAQSG